MGYFSSHSIALNPSATIVLDCERMKYPHTGLYHYCLHLGRNLVERNKELHKLCFYLPSGLVGLFGKDQCYLPQQVLHKLFLPDTRNVDIWHSTHQTTHYFPWNFKGPVVLTVHDLNYIYDSRKSAEKKKTYLRKMKKKIDRADHIIAISDYTRNDLQKHFDLGNKPCSTIYNGCNIEAVTEVKDPAYLPKQPFLFTIGTIAEKKNFHVLPPLLKQNDLQLVIAGITHSQEYKQKIIEVAKSHKVQDRLVFTGPVSENDKQWYLKHCRAFLFPSISEGFGLPVVEAMYFGKPVLLSKATSLPEIGGAAAYYFESFDPLSMQDTLVKSLQDYEANDRCGSIRLQSEKFSWPYAAEQYLNVYDSLK
ncbi:MAG TPA: glycosyltransferase family 1 protein [Flavisolibacter sp.]|jgi:glycosyltransferase involved in cell wall biosynthesis|nr:glycosyltransferase family 1 protein [Flavisolibacter sp.]